jgi:hypothetical protein
MTIWNALIGLAWIPLVMEHALWAWYFDHDLTTYWMLCVLALCVCYGGQWAVVNKAPASKVDSSGGTAPV